MAGLRVVLYVDEARYEEIKKNGFSKDLGYWCWDISIMGTPMDTGNARRNVVLQKNAPRHIRIVWDLFGANYVEYLEEGRGPVKKYKGFISVDIASAIMEQTMAWILTGDDPSYTVRPRPFVALGTSRHEPFSMERTFLRQANMNASKITAKSRMMISNIRTLNASQGLVPSKERGERIDTKIQKGSKTSYFNRNVSQLQRIYNKRKEDTAYLT